MAVDLNDIWNEGWEAYNKGFSTTFNPYFEEDRSEAWENGWFDCREFRDRINYESLGA